jgi:L-lysine 6-transaminase
VIAYFRYNRILASSSGFVFIFSKMVDSFGKKAQVCGILASKTKLDEVEHHVFAESSRINSTFGGNFIDMLRFQLVLEIIEKENLLENVQKQGEFLLEGLQKLQAKFPHLISNARGRGLMCAFDFPEDFLFR